jgi:hypothetical protein
MNLVLELMWSLIGRLVLLCDEYFVTGCSLALACWSFHYAKRLL